MALKSSRPRVLFVGGFRPGPDGARGGQMIACTTLVNSQLSEEVSWILIDSTAATNKHRSFLARLLPALRRLLTFIWHLLFSKVDSVLLFCSAGFSFREKGWMAIIAKKMGKRVILAPRSGLIKNDIENNADFRKFLVRVFRHLDVLICQGPSWHAYYSPFAHQLPLHLEIIHNWIDLEQFEGPLTELPESDEFIVLFLGWMTANKGVFDILEAAQLIHDPRVVFYLGGHGDAFAEVESIIQEKQLEKKVRLLGWVTGDEKMALLRQAKLFLLPSYREGYPNALLEAMACGLPAVATRVGSIPDMITPGQNGYLVDPGAPDQIADSILNILTNEVARRNFGEAARKRVLSNNKLNIATEKFSSILSDIHG